MVLEQGALSGNYDQTHPFPEGSARAASYNSSLPELGELVNEMRNIASAHDATVAQIATAWAIAKGTLPIIGVTKVKHVEDAAKSAEINLSPHEILHIEELGEKTNIITLREWEKEMV